MAFFFVRPEINNASKDDYTKLHEEMYNRNIYRVVLGTTDTWFDLPSGTYHSEDTKNLKELFDLANAAVLAVVTRYTPAKKYELIVFENSNSRFLLKKNTDKTKLPKRNTH